MITHISYALHAPSPKVHTLASELLAAICMLSVTDGHKAVLAALSDFRIAFDEDFRFETLLSTLRLADVDFDNDSDSGIGFGNEEDGVWDARIGTMTLVNALTNCPEDLEERVLLREELSRRGLNELIVVCCFYLIQQVLVLNFLNINHLGSSIYQTARFAPYPTQPVYGREI